MGLVQRVGTRVCYKCLIMVCYNGLVGGRRTRCIHGFGTKGWDEGLLQMVNNGGLRWFGGKAYYQV